MLIYYAFLMMWRSPISILCEWDWWVSTAAPDSEIYSDWSNLQEHPPLSTVIALWGLSKFKINYTGDGPVRPRARGSVYFRQTHYMCRIFTFLSVFVRLRPISPWICDVLHQLVNFQYTWALSLHSKSECTDITSMGKKKTLNASQKEVQI